MSRQFVAITAAVRPFSRVQAEHRAQFGQDLNMGSGLFEIFRPLVFEVRIDSAFKRCLINENPAALVFEG